MSYKIVKSIPEGSKHVGNDTVFISDGYVAAWGTNAAFGRYVEIDKYDTPTGEHIALERRTVSKVTEDEARDSLRSAGY